MSTVPNMPPGQKEWVPGGSAWCVHASLPFLYGQGWSDCAYCCTLIVLHFLWKGQCPTFLFTFSGQGSPVNKCFGNSAFSLSGESLLYTCRLMGVHSSTLPHPLDQSPCGGDPYVHATVSSCSCWIYLQEQVLGICYCRSTRQLEKLDKAPSCSPSAGLTREPEKLPPTQYPSAWEV